MLTLTTVFRFFLGDRSAILAIATDPHALPVGFLLTLSAGLARHYNRTDLRRHPWRVLVPAAASALLALLLLLLLHLKTLSAPTYSLTNYRGLLACFWFTAPLAWLYAIPWHRVLNDERRALNARLWTLAAVSAWRLFLAFRVATLLFDGHDGAAAALVLLFADSVALLALFLTRSKDPDSTPRVIDAMAAPPFPTRRQREDLRKGGCLVAFWGTLTLPIWLVAAIHTDAPKLVTFPAREALAGTPTSLYAFASAAFIAFAALLPFTQPPHRRRTRADALLIGGNVADGLAYLSAFAPADLPRGYQPPPVNHFREPPTLLALMEAICNHDPARWVRSAYLESFRDFLADPRWYRDDPRDLERTVALLYRLPEGPQLAVIMRDSLRQLRRWRRELLDIDRNAPAAIASTDHRERSATTTPAPRPPLHLLKTLRAVWQLANKTPS